MSLTQPEKEKLRKKLLKLFEKNETGKHSTNTTGKIKGYKNIEKSKSHKQKQLQLDNSKNLKKPQLPVKNSDCITKAGIKQNCYVKIGKKHDLNEKISVFKQQLRPSNINPIENKKIKSQPKKVYSNSATSKHSDGGFKNINVPGVESQPERNIEPQKLTNGKVSSKQKMNSNIDMSEGSFSKKDKHKKIESQNKKNEKISQLRPSNINPTENKKTKGRSKKGSSKSKKAKHPDGSFKTINVPKVENTAIESQPERSISKLKNKTTCNSSDTIPENNIVQKNNVKKRTWTDNLNTEAVVISKKQKLNKKARNVKKSKKNQKPTSDESDINCEDDCDINGMSGFVRGGDFDSSNEEDEIEHKYWMQAENCSEEDDYNTNKIVHGNNVVQKFRKNSLTDVPQSDPDTYSDTEDDDEEFNCYFSDSYDEEGNYSDFDENDYEEDEDSYDYCMDDYYDDMFDSNCSDEDYELPSHVAEDLVIHKGTATKHDLKPQDQVSFDSENPNGQIVELENQQPVKVIYQPKAYRKEELLKLKYNEKVTFQQEERTSTEPEDCPKLVPIVDKNGFQLYNSNEYFSDQVEEEQEEIDEEYDNDNTDLDSLGSEYIEMNSDDTDSILSEDINEKYLCRGQEGSFSDNSIDINIWNLKHKVDVIDATGYQYENKVDDSTEASECSINDDIKQIPSMRLYENVDLKTETSIFTTSIIDYPDDSNATGTISTRRIDAITSEEEAEDNVIVTEQSSKISKSFADYNTKFFNAFESNLVLVLLKDPFYIYGTACLTLLAGTVEIYGYSVELNREVEIFSPRGCSEIEISAAHAKCDISSKQKLEQLLTTYEKHFALADLKTIADLYNSATDAVVLLKRNEARKKLVQQFKKFMNENVFPNIYNINVDHYLYNSQSLLRCMISISAQEQKSLRLPTEWRKLSITTKSRIMITGGKGVGKSTLLRYLINRNLPQKALLIDLDIGQPEVFVPQTISCTIIEEPLLGPGFLLNLQPDISYVVGHTNISLCAHTYIAAVRSLIAHCTAQDEYKEIPWLVNTMGYNKGFGLELISVIAQELPLTDVVQLQSTKEISNFDSILHSHVLDSVPYVLFAEDCDDKEETIKKKLNYRLHVWQSVIQSESRYQKEWEMTAKDLRFAMLLARLTDALQGHAHWLTDTIPVRTSLNDLKIINLMENSSSASVEELEKSLEANLVYLCQYEEDNEPLKCLGIGVVRGIDFHVRQLYLVPALPHTQLKAVNCLAIGEMSLPTSLFINQGPKIKGVAPFLYNAISANASKAIKQIYHRPRKFLTGKHKSIN